MVISEAFQLCIFKKHQDGAKLKTLTNYRSTVNSLVKACGDMPVELIDETVIMRWQLFREQQGHKSSTVAHDISRLREVLKYLHKRNVKVISFRDVEIPRIFIEPKDHVAPTEARQMIDYATNTRDKALVAVLWSSGSRISEVLSLNRDALHDPKPKVIGKNSKEVVVRLDDTARHCIAEYLDERGDRLPALFISSQMRRMTVQRAEQIVNQIAGELGVARPDGTEKNITPHSFRRGLATDMDLNGAGIVDIQVALGHTNISTTRGYINVHEKRGDEAHARFHTKV